ncbi:GNAT family N-acetyltransferase [Cellulosimicrobium cellulans]|uniref:GNAT family N-acetyltransferase n=1 Tax=Cellulosimicrobium cellulans TaxID=1710 RepID=UPI002ED6F6DD
MGRDAPLVVRRDAGRAGALARARHRAPVRPCTLPRRARRPACRRPACRRPARRRPVRRRGSRRHPGACRGGDRCVVGRPGPTRADRAHGVHADHRGRGLGRAVTLAGLAALRELGASSALVATPASNVGGVATYVSAGFTHLPERFDRRRDGS